MIEIIAAISKDNCIAKDGIRPWHYTEDLKHFRRLTKGKTVIMGRKTWEAIPKKYRPLPYRTNVVITAQKNFPVPKGVKVYNDIQTALTSHKHDNIVIIGGGQIYEQTFSLASTLHITEIHKHIDGNIFFPKIKQHEWKEITREDHKHLSFVTYKKQHSHH